MKNDNLELLDILSITSFCIALLNYQENRKQTSNNELLKELYKQDDLINEKIIEKLNKIEKQNSDIISLLKGGNYGN